MASSALWAVVAAAGESRRMGSSKALLELEGKPLLRRLVELHRAAGLPVCVVLGRDRRRIEASVDFSGVAVVVNPEPERGPLSSLQTALDHLVSAGGVLVHPVDHPFVKESTPAALRSAWERDGDRILIPEYQGRKGHPVVFPSSLFGELHSAPLEQGARWVVRRNPQRVLRVSVEDEGILANVNTPEQWRSYLRSFSSK